MLTERELFISLVDNDSIRKSDAIVLLEGDGLNRYPHAVKLFREGWAPLLVFSGGITDYDYGSFPYTEIKPLLLQAGIPEGKLYHEARSLNTHAQAEEMVKLCREQNWKKIILVASPYHQYRAYLTFLKSLQKTKSKIVIFNAPVRQLPWFTSNRWGDRYHCLQKEFDRIEKYSTFGHLATYHEAIEYQRWKENII